MEFVKRQNLADVCRELGRLRRDELVALMFPAQEMLKERGPQGSRKASPPPWFSPAAELIDAIDRGAVRWQNEGRAALGEEPWSGTRAAALAQLPGLVEALAREGSELGERVTESGVVRDGAIEECVRDWHRQARELTGQQRRLERLPSVPNPDHPSHGGHRRLGPVCWRCTHRSCQRIVEGGKRSLWWPCPTCGSDSLRYDPSSGQVWCIRPGCSDSGSSWPLALFEQAAHDPWEDSADEE